MPEPAANIRIARQEALEIALYEVAKDWSITEGVQAGTSI